MNRRRFFSFVALAAGATTTVPVASRPVAFQPMTRRGFFGRLAACLVVKPALQTVCRDATLGNSIRFVRHWEPLPMRYAVLRPEWSVRIKG